MASPEPAIAPSSHLPSNQSPSAVAHPALNPMIAPLTDAYRQAYGRINGVVVVGEALAERHFRLLARLIPADAAELQRLGAMEGRHARDFVGCANNLGSEPDLRLARQLFAPLQALFRDCDRRGDLASCLVIQCLIVECFAVAAYRVYLPVADAYAKPITAAVLQDEVEHLNYGEVWLQQRFDEVKDGVAAICAKALPLMLPILQALVPDMLVIGMDPLELLVGFNEIFEQSLEAIGFERRVATRLTLRALAA